MIYLKSSDREKNTRTIEEGKKCIMKTKEFMFVVRISRLSQVWNKKN
jgi:hypothetical protein